MMGLFDKLKKNVGDNLDKQIAEMQAKNEALTAQKQAEAQSGNSNAAAPVQKRMCEITKVEENETTSCSCGCGRKAEYIIKIGNNKIPVSNDCGNLLSLKFLGVGQTIDEDIMETEAGNFTGRTTDNRNFKINYGLASDDSSNVFLFNETNEKGVLFTWENLQFLAILLGILD